MGMSGLSCVVPLLLLLNCFLHIPSVLCDDYPSANLSTVWINNSSLHKGNPSFFNSSIIRPILLIEKANDTGFCFGFYSNGTSSLFILVVFYTPLGSNSSDLSPQILWSANRDQSVREDARLELTAQGDLVLRDADGTFVWSTNTSGLSITSMKLTAYGNLQLLNGSASGVVWQSIDHRINTLVPKQALYIGQRLTDSISEPRMLSNLLNDVYFGDCSYPTVCGNYGVCSDGQCSCPGNTSYFRQVSALQPNRGCSEVTPLSCKHTKLHTFLQLEDVTYFDFVSSLSSTDVESCKRACLSNCSCKAVLFRYQNNMSSGNCSLPLQLFSLMSTKKDKVGYNSYAFIKVQRSMGAPISIVLIWVLLLVFLSSLMLLAIKACYSQVTKKKSSTEEEGGGEEDDVSSMLTRFSFETLTFAMQSVGRRLGGGAFGSVYEGVLENGTRVAVKILESVHQGRSEFLAELNTLGSIHHVNLVRLIGYCTKGSNKLLVYEHICNGSLDNWIFDQNRAQNLNWEVRRKIIVGIANGLQYLHEHCNQNIIHFDIKPQNILLDENFNVKISDFGLAKLIDRNQSQVLTSMKGTPGYAAPELIGGRHVSVKADVYSFGIVILEIVCGRKNIEASQKDYLIDIVKIKAEEERLLDLIDDRNQDMHFHRGEAMKMVEIAIWCLQPHFQRPSMSMVVKVLEGLMDVKPISDYTFLTLVHLGNPSEANPSVSAPLMASILSGPRE